MTTRKTTKRTTIFGTKVTKLKIPNNELELASIYFTLSNCALLDLIRNPNNLISEYHNINNIVYSETGVGLEKELKSWVKEVNKAKEGDYVYEEWQKKRKKYS